MPTDAPGSSAHSLAAVRPAVLTAGRALVAAPFARLLAAWLLLVVAFGASSSKFLTVGNGLNVGRAVSIYGVAAVGLTVALIAGSVDVSVGAVMSMGGLLAAERLQAGDGVLIALAVAVAVGLAVGIGNGVLAIALKLDSLIITLGTLSIIGAWTYTHNGGVTQVVLSQSFLHIGVGTWAGVPVVVWMLAVSAVLIGLMLRFTGFGQRCYAVGDNPRAAVFAGVRVRSVKTAALGISGATAAFAGALLAANLGQAAPGQGEPYLLNIFAAVVIGGTSLAGGEGTVIGTVVGLALLGTIDNGLDIHGVSSYVQSVVSAAILLAALVLDRVRRKTR